MAKGMAAVAVVVIITNQRSLVATSRSFAYDLL